MTKLQSTIGRIKQFQKSIQYTKFASHSKNPEDLSKSLTGLCKEDMDNINFMLYQGSTRNTREQQPMKKQ